VRGVVQNLDHGWPWIKLARSDFKCSTLILLLGLSSDSGINAALCTSVGSLTEIVFMLVPFGHTPVCSGRNSACMSLLGCRLWLIDNPFRACTMCPLGPLGLLHVPNKAKPPFDDECNARY
jgi:hypothetical protein